MECPRASAFALAFMFERRESGAGVWCTVHHKALKPFKPLELFTPSQISRLQHSIPLKNTDRNQNTVPTGTTYSTQYTVPPLPRVCRQCICYLGKPLSPILCQHARGVEADAIAFGALFLQHLLDDAPQRVHRQLQHHVRGGRPAPEAVGVQLLGNPFNRDASCIESLDDVLCERASHARLDSRVFAGCGNLCGRRPLDRRLRTRRVGEAALLRPDHLLCVCVQAGFFAFAILHECSGRAGATRVKSREGVHNASEASSGNVNPRPLTLPVPRDDFTRSDQRVPTTRIISSSKRVAELHITRFT